MGQSSRKMGAVRTACAEIQPKHQVLTGLTVQFLKKRPEHLRGSQDPTRFTMVVCIERHKESQIVILEF